MNAIASRLRKAIGSRWWQNGSGTPASYRAKLPQHDEPARRYQPELDGIGRRPAFRTLFGRSD
ncbi:hypothetical protein [Enterovirga rhinocerotis]|uniref:hypothetical protein n=1 Tax=Enterovirga rhinocerotis TaxID=1339210 RepID=UPI001414D5D1|nr:hypothetical protein [Enterovirga rhinocerotis]